MCVCVCVCVIGVKKTDVIIRGDDGQSYQWVGNHIQEYEAVELL